MECHYSLVLLRNNPKNINCMYITRNNNFIAEKKILTDIVFCGFLFCSFFFLGGSLPHEESSLVVNKGEELRLKCNKDGPVTWNFQNSDPSAKTKSSNEKEWYTKNATVRDIGRYVCKSKGSIVTSFYVFVKGNYY